MNETKIAQQLEAKWIELEIKCQSRLDQNRKAFVPSQGLASRTEQLSECRRQLQEAFGLVVEVGKDGLKKP